jgi:hypothetical protein
VAAKKQLAIYLAITMLAFAAVLTELPQTAAAPKVDITFKVNGYSNYSGALLTIDGTTYYTWNFPVTLKLKPDDTYTVTAVPLITGWDLKNYSFVSWTNGNGLITNTGTFTIPSDATNVTANYAQSTYTATFATSGLSNINGNVLQIDGTGYTISALGSTSFLWAPGSTHTVVALEPVYNYDTPPKGFNFTSWTNGNGLVTASGTFTMPSSDVTVTANYAQSTVQVTFATTGLSNLNSDTILTIDGTPYDYWDIANLKFQWMKGSTHTITAVSSVTGWDTVKHDFNSWTNGNGLTTNSGTFTTPTADAVITANYVTSTTTNYVARFTTSGMTNINGNVLQIDGEYYAYTDLPSTTFNWAAGSTHTVIAIQPVYSYDTPSKGYNFNSWTNGNGLVTASGTFTMPESDVTITANYVQATVQVTFATSGISNVNTDTILTIDGVQYDYWDIQNINVQWMPGTTHAISAVSSITGWDTVTHYFRSWTNGNGLTTNTGTFTTPSSNVAVTVNYGLTPTIATVLTVECSSTSVAPGGAVTIQGTLSGEGLGVESKTVTLGYYDGVNWNIIGAATTTSGGYYSYPWTLPSSIAEGEYPLKADFGGDILYLASSASTGTPGNGGNVHVLPELWGSIVAFFACLCGTFVFVGVRSRKSKEATAQV